MAHSSPARCFGLALAAVVCLLGAPSTGRAEDSRLRELDLVLANLEKEPAASGTVALAPLVAELERRDASRRSEFTAAQSRKLSGKAADRLTRARQAYDAGHGRLLQLLRSLQANADKTAGRPGFDRESAIREAREILARIAKASEPEPISTTSLSVAAPMLAPLMGQGTPAADRPIDAIPETLKAFAATLDGPVAVYEWVRNNVRPDFYFGVLKGPVQAYLEQSANDADTASLLIALFRAKGVPARYARATVELPAATLQSLTGTGSVTQAVRVLERAGIPHEVVLGASAVSAVRMERVWAEVYLPYANYRGTSLDAQGKVWVPLDPGFKQIGTPGGIDVVGDLGLDPRETLDAFLAGAQDVTPLAYLRDRVGTLVAEQRPGTPYADVLARRDHVLETLGLLPSSLPYRVIGRPDVAFELPDTLHHTVRLVGEADTPLLDVTVPTADVLGHRLTLSYVPATEEDAALAKSYGGIARTPPYLIEVRPVIKKGGVEIAVGSAPVGMGVRFTFRIELRSPGGTQVVTNNLIAGNLTAIGLGGREVTATEADQEQAAQILSRLAWAYLDKWNQSDAELSRLLRVVPVRPTVSACLVMSDIQVDYAGGDPLYPIAFDWRGLAIDADHRATAPVGLESIAEEKAFLLMSGLEGSVLEHRIFEEELDVASVSTAKGLGLAHAQGIEIADLTSSNADAILATLPFDLAVKDDIRQATARGLLARVPTAPLVTGSWRGVPYLLLDEETGEAAYQLQGGRSGGVTVPTVIDFPAVLRDTLELQGETPAPETSDVARIQKFGTTDFQEETVNQRLPRPFKVLVTDRDGFPVRNARVTFTVMGGGGTLEDPATGITRPTDLDVFSDIRGEAQVKLILGKRTDVIPRFVQLEGDEFSTQVGVNLVTARAGNVTLSEPFTAIAFPDEQFDGQLSHATFALLSDPFVDGLFNLRVAGRLGVRVQDQFGNPLSNWPMTFTAISPAVQGTPPAGYSLYDGPTTTPGFVLNTADYAECIKRFANPGWGDCTGEASVVTVNSSSLGAFAYAVVGDSTYSSYFFHIGNANNAHALSVWYGTWGQLCNSPNVSDCRDSVRPGMFVAAGSRAVRVNRLGNNIEAYPLGGDAEAVFWADVVLEKERVERTVDGQGRVHYHAIGTNEWRRERLTDSQFVVNPLTPGTHATAATHIGEGNYASVMTMGSAPQLNVVRADAKHFPPDIPYLSAGSGDPNEIDPAYVDDATLTVRRVKDTARPWQGSVAFSLWGVDAALTRLQPRPVLLDRAGAVSRTATVDQRIAPDAFRELLEPTQVVFDLKREGAPVVSATGANGPFVIPAGLPLPGGGYTAQLSVLGLSSSGASIVSEPFPVPTCNLLSQVTAKLYLSVTRDPLDGTMCGEQKPIKFVLCRDAVVTLTVDGAPVTGAIDKSGVPMPLTSVPLTAGEHSFWLPPDVLGVLTETAAFFVVTAIDQADPLSRGAVEGVLERPIRNRSVLPVGHTFVKGVDLLDGHVVQQSGDLAVPGRHLGLDVTRTYSSAGRSSEGVMGAGWAFNYASSLAVGDCGLVNVSTADGSSQVFRTIDGGHTFTPQKGYHTRLAKLADGSYDFVDKAGTRHHFREAEDPTQPDTARRLEYIEEPHGDRIVLTYDSAGRVVKVAEVQRGGVEVRTLVVTYTKAGGFDRIAKVTAPGLALEASYGYDEFGNLITVTRSGANVAGPAADGWTKRYEYRTTESVDRHQLVAAVDPNGNRTEYVYYTNDDVFLGADAGVTLPGNSKQEYVKEVREFPGPGITQSTRFSYDYRDAATLKEFKTTVRDGRGNDTRYVMNPGGSPLRIEEPLGKTTRMVWSDTDVLKMSETNALGRVTEYGYDERGNLTSERVLTADLGSVETTYAYDPAFNKLTFKRDAEGRETRYVISSEGDLRSMTDAVGNVTGYDYDDEGRLTSVTDPRGHATSHSDHDSFGHPRTITDALGNVTTREYDPRGRLSHETDTLRHDASTVYDGLDRPITVTRVAGGASADEVNRTEYFAGGEVKATTNPLGARTFFTLDGLNRVVKTSVVVAEDTLVTSAEYDANGNKTSETDRRGVTRRMTYDVLNRLTKVEIVGGLSGEGPMGQVAAYTYDLVGNKDSETNVAGLVTRFGFDGLYRVVRKTLPEGSSPGTPYFELYAYDRVGNRTSVTDANGHATLFGYDGLNRVVRTENALGHVVTATFADPEGSKVNKAEEHDTTRGLRTTFAYDLLNRETQRKVFLEGAGSSGEVYTTGTAYDDPGHALTVTDARGTRTRTALDGLDHPVTVVVDVDGLTLTTRTTYDGLGNRTEVVDPRQASTRFAYDSLGRLRTMTDALTHAASYRYDGGGLKIRETDRRGVERQFSYDNLGRPRVTTLVPSISGVASRREVVYDDRGRKRTEIDARSHPTVANLDGLDRVVRLADARGGTVLTRWDGVNRREETDKRGNTTKFDYDDLNRPVRVTDPAPFSAQTVETTYLDAQNRVSVKDRRGALTVTQMDPLGRTLTVTRAGITQETNAYDEVGNKTSAKDGEGKETRFTYDAANRLSERTDGFGTPDVALTTYKYDANGNRTEERDARAASLGEPWSVRNTYDVLNRVETMTDGETDVTRYAYDEEGNRTSVVEPEQQETTYTYDELGKLLRVVQPGNRATSYQYDPNRNRVLQTDANGHEVRMTYDELDRMDALVQNPAGFGFRTSHVYDANGNETVLTDPKGQTVTSTYDELNRLKTKAYAYPASDPVRPWRHTTSIAYVYDANGNLTRIEDSVASGTDPPSAPLVTTREYDDLDRLLSEVSPLPDGGTRTVAYTYFANGTRKTVTGPSAETSSYTYDGQNRLATATTAGGVTTYAYFPDDLLRSVTYPSGVTATHAYDKADRLTSLVNARNTTTVSSFTYGYDRNGNRLSQVEVNGGPAETTGYTYDALNRLATVTYPVDTNYPAGRVVTYALDDAGNRTRETERTTAGAILADKQGVFDNLNRLTTLTDLVDGSKTTTFSWDANGNQRTKTVGAVTTEYRYDCRDKLVEVVEGSSTPGRFQYDFAGRRSKKIGSDGVVQYVYDQTSVLAEFDGSAVPVAKYEYGSDRLISMSRSGEGRRWYSLDALRSVVNLTDDSGSTVASYHLDAWGYFRFPSELTASKNRFAFTGYEWDPELGLFNAKARYFDPQIGRFTSQDSFLGQIDDPPSLHRYFYANDNPTRYIDPTGHESASVVYQSVNAAELHQEAEAQAAKRVEIAKLCADGCFSAIEGSALRGGLYYGAETAAEFVWPAPLGLSSPESSYHPFAESGQVGADYRAFVDRFGRGAQVMEGAAVMKFGGKPGKVIGAVMVIGAMAFGGTLEVNGTQGEEGNFGPDQGERQPLPAEKEKLTQPPVRAGERTTFEDFRARSVAGDELEGHEIVQHAKLKDQGLAGKRRLSTPASRENPVIALEKEIHAEVTAEQLKQGTKDLPIVESLRANVKILLDKTEIPRQEIAKLLKDAYAHAKKWKVE